MATVIDLTPRLPVRDPWVEQLREAVRMLDRYAEPKPVTSLAAYRARKFTPDSNTPPSAA